jgi:hypothetical protein
VTSNLIAIIQGKAKTSTKWLLGAIVSFATLMQIDAVKNLVTPLVAHHPKVSSIIAALIAIGTLLHNPTVQQVFGLGTVVPTATLNEPPKAGQ